jgi:hypothetical protein
VFIRQLVMARKKCVFCLKIFLSLLGTVN